MEISKGYYLGNSGQKFILWNEKHLFCLDAKNLQSAVKEAELIIKNK